MTTVTRSALSQHSSLAPQSIAQIAQLIQGTLRELKRLGPLLVHAQWIRPQPNKGMNGFMSVTLADAARTDIAVDGIIWDRADIDAVLKMGQRFGVDLLARDARCEVVLEATIDCWVKQSKVYLNIHRLSSIGMVGLKQQQRNAAIQALTSEGILTRNKDLRLPVPAFRIALVTKDGSAASADTLSILRQSGFAFRPTLFPVTVQGTQAVPTLCRAFEQVQERVHEFDAVMLVRGGGSEIDLLAYDALSAARAVAVCPLPVITGLGHQIDQSVCDLVAHHATETPTAAAQWLVGQAAAFLTNVTSMSRQILTASDRHCTQTRTAVLAQTTPILQRCLCWLHAARQRTTLTTGHIVQDSSRRVVVMARQQLAQRLTAIHTNLLITSTTAVRLTQRAVLSAINTGVRAVLQRARMTIHDCTARLEALNLEHLLQLGLAYVMDHAGAMIRDPSVLAAKDQIRIRFLRYDVTATITSIKEHHDDPSAPHNRERPHPTRLPRRRTRRTQSHQ